jgi:hypothetical protein
MTRAIVVSALLGLGALAVAAPLERTRTAAPVTVIAYGDTRFTDTANTTASNPDARRVLVARIADEHPDAILVSGDLPWHGGTVADYDEFRKETTAWRDRQLRLRLDEGPTEGGPDQFRGGDEPRELRGGPRVCGGRAGLQSHLFLRRRR